jgi:tripartite-type tricarboxylate transporter receptor subunit TctC
MHGKMRLLGFCFVAAALLQIVPAVLHAQTYPSKPVRVVVTVAPGGLQDQLARGIAQALGAVWNQTVIVENRPGAGGVAAAEAVVRAAPDGYSILQTDNAWYLTNTFLRPNQPYNLEKDFAPAIMLVYAKNILVASTEFPAKNLQEIFALAKQKPGVYNYGSFGIGTINHIDTEALAAIAGVRFTHVPYKGGAPLLQAVLTHEIHFTLAGMTAAIPLIRQGRIRALAYGGLARSHVFPDVPTLSESGVKGFESSAWFAWAVPAATPRDIIDKIYNDTARVLATPEVREKFVLGPGHEPASLPGSKVLEFLAAEKPAFAARIKPLNLKLD